MGNSLPILQADTYKIPKQPLCGCIHVFIKVKNSHSLKIKLTRYFLKEIIIHNI